MLQLSPTPSLSLNDGWTKLATLLKHLEDGLFGGSAPDNPSAFTPADYAEAHSLAYQLCTQKPSLCGDLYRRLGIHAADVASKAVQNGTEYNAATYMRRMAQIFSYIDQTYVARRALPSVSEAINDAFYHARAARDVGPAMSRLTLTTNMPLGDSDQPIDLVGEEGGGGSGGGGGAGPSSGDPNLRPPTPDDPEDSDFEELSREQFRDAVAGRIAPCVAPGLRLGTTVFDGKRMTGLFATRRFEKCTPIGVYTGTPMLGSEFNTTTKKIAKEYAYQLKPIEAEGTKLSFVIVPPYGAYGKVDLKMHPLSALNEPPSGTVSNVVMQQMVVPLEQMKQEGRPSDVIEPLVMLVGYTTRKVEPGEQLFLHYGTSYQDFRTYSAGNPSSVQCSNDVQGLFPSGVPWSCVVQIPRRLLDEQDSDDDPEWKPGRGK